MTDKKQKIFRKKLVPAPVAFGFSVGKLESEPTGAHALVASSKSSDPHKIPMELQREADRLLLARYVPPAVLINHQLEIIQTRGRTASFLELPSGKASLNLLKMARPGLLFELQSAIDEARKKGFEAIRQGVHDYFYANPPMGTRIAQLATANPARPVLTTAASTGGAGE